MRRGHARAQAEERARELLRQKRFAARAGGRVDEGESAIDRFLILTHETLKRNEQAALLGVERSRVTEWRRALVERGAIAWTARKGRPPITEAEAEAIARLYRQGLTAALIAEQRGTNQKRVVDALRRAGVGEAVKPSLWGSRQLRGLLSVNAATVRRFIAEGWLPAARVGLQMYGWDRADIYALLRRRGAWLALSPATISDPDFAAFLRREQALAGGRWYGRADLAGVIGVSAATISIWLRTGQIDLSTLPAITWSGTDAVWLTDAQARALEAAAAPVRAVTGRGAHIVRRAVDRVRPQIRAALGSPRAAAAD